MSVFLADLFPRQDADGGAVMHIFWLTATIYDEQKDRPCILMSDGPKGKNYIPTTGELSWYNTQPYVTIPDTYRYFAQTGLRKTSFALCHKPQFNIKRTRAFCGWLRGPLVNEVIACSTIPFNITKSNPPSERVSVQIRPWAFDDLVVPKTKDQVRAVSLWETVSRACRSVHPGDMAYDGKRILCGRMPPTFDAWVRSATEWLYDHEAPSSDVRLWRDIAYKNPAAIRRLMLSRDSNFPLSSDISDADVERMSLAEAAVIALAWGDKKYVSPRIMKFLQERIAPLFVMEALA